MKRNLIFYFNGPLLAITIYSWIFYKNIFGLVLLLLFAVSVFQYLLVKNLLPGLPFGYNERKYDKVQFKDIGGQDRAIKELQEALDFLNLPEEVLRLGIRPIKGILLTGPPGTGKTLLAKAAATYTDSVFLAVAGSEFVEVYAGNGAKKVRQIFNDARRMARKEKKKHAVIFIDEMEVVGGKRGRVSNQVEYDQTLNQLLVEMDGCRPEDDINILIIGATNRPDLLDDALLRPGRFDRHLEVSLPDLKGRLDILKIHLRNKPVKPDVDLLVLAKQTYGFSGAQLASVVNEAAIYALRSERQEIVVNDFFKAIDKILLGEHKDILLTQQDKHRIAVHEMGHALISEYYFPKSIAQITIVPRGKALGFIRSVPENDETIKTASELRKKIRVLLAGGLAEEIVLGEKSTGSKGDYHQALQYAKELVLCGMGNLLLVDISHLSQERLLKEIEEIARSEAQIVLEVLTNYKYYLLQLSEILLEKETLSGDEFYRLLPSFSD